MLTVPLNKPPMYSLTDLLGWVGFGPYRFGLLDPPLPLATYSRLSAGLNRTAVGYQPVGMNPWGTALAGSATLNTLRLLASALATSRICVAGISVRLLGVFPLGAVG